MLQRDNVLILDEPTNHLDIDSKEMLEQALKDFEGTIIFVSHDFGFLDHVVDQYLVMYGGFLIEYIKDKNKLKTAPEDLHPYTQDLLEILFFDNKSNSYDELASHVDLKQKLNACPYISSCKYIGNGNDFEERCNNEIPPIINTNKKNQDSPQLGDSWQRCWRDINGK